MKSPLPPSRRVTGAPDIPVKVYIHAQLDQQIVKRLKSTAMKRGYKLGEFLDILLDNVLPKE